MRTATAGRLYGWTAALVMLLLASAAASWAQDGDSEDAARVPAALSKPATVRLWDTVTPLRVPVNVKRRNGWRAALAGATSRVQGDLVMETDGLAAVLASGLGKVLVYAPGDPGRAKAELLPVELKGKRATIAAITVGKQQAGAVTVRADFRASGAKSVPVAFSFSNDHILTEIGRAHV